MTAIDTPDGQQGVTGPQALIGSFGAAQQAGSVPVPENCGSVWIIASGINNANHPLVVGQNSLSNYPAYQVKALTSSGNDSFWIIPSIQSVDISLTITWGSVPGASWFVIADTLSRFNVSVGMGSQFVPPSQDSLGDGYVIDTVPSVLAGDHPANELQLAYTNLGVSGNLIAAPGAGKRLRLYRGKLILYTNPASTWASLNIGKNSTTPAMCLCGLAPGTNGLPIIDTFKFDKTGMPTDTNTAVTLTLGAASAAICWAEYTVETV